MSSNINFSFPGGVTREESVAIREGFSNAAKRLGILSHADRGTKMGEGSSGNLIRAVVGGKVVCIHAPAPDIAESVVEALIAAASTAPILALPAAERERVRDYLRHVEAQMKYAQNVSRGTQEGGK